jgi:pyruvate kinase
MSRIAQTKIVATLGPACADKKILSRMIDAGMNVARINFSHGTHESNGAMIATVRALAKKQKKTVMILQDIQGPKMRLGILPEAGIVLKAKQSVVFSTDSATALKKGCIPVDVPKLETFLKKGEHILIADGTIEVVVVKVVKKEIETKVVVGGTVFSHKGLNFPDSKIPLRPLTQKDKDDLKFGASIGVDFVAISFVQKPEDVVEVCDLLSTYNKSMRGVRVLPKIIAKIERREAVDCAKEILAVADGIMVARGDLGLEIPAEEVPVIQKTLIQQTILQHKSVIVATQMLDSMQHSPRPTRAEVSDVANAVIDHTDAVMLSNETASGEYPVESVEMMYRIIVETEKSLFDDGVLSTSQQIPVPTDEALGVIAAHVSGMVDIGAIVVLSDDDILPRAISRQRPEVLVYRIVYEESDVRRSALCWGVLPLVLPKQKQIAVLIRHAVSYLLKQRVVRKKQSVVVVVSHTTASGQQVHTVEIIRA